MNQELQTFLLDLLKQVIAGIPFGTILSLVVYYALSKVKKKTIEFPTRVNDLSDKLNGFYEATKVMFASIVCDIKALLITELTAYKEQSENYKKIVESYRQELNVMVKNTQALVAQNEILIDVLKVYISENQNSVISGIAKTTCEKIKNYKEHAYLAQEVVSSYLVQYYPETLIKRLAEISPEALENMVKQYEKEKSQG